MRKKTGSITPRGKKSFRISYYDANGIRQYETIKGTEADAQRELAIRLGELAKGLPVSSKPNTVRFEELAADVVNDYIVNGHSSMKDIDARFRLHLNPVFGNRKASQITTAQIKAYIVMRQNQGASAGTINRELEAMRRAFRLAHEGRKLLVMPYIPMLREDNVRTGFFTREEVDRLCTALDEPYCSFVLFGFLTGWRYDEIRNLEWRNVDFKKNEIRLDVGSTKNRDGRMFPMTIELRQLMETLAPAESTDTIAIVNGPTATTVTRYVFHIDGVQIGAFRKTWKSACYKAGLPCIVEPITRNEKPVIGKDGRTKVRVLKSIRTFHDLRRSFAREMDTKGIRQGAIMKLGGWKTDSVFRRYNIVSDGDLRDAIDLLNGAKNGAKSRGQDS